MYTSPRLPSRNLFRIEEPWRLNTGALERRAAFEEDRWLFVFSGFEVPIQTQPRAAAAAAAAAAASLASRLCSWERHDINSPLLSSLLTIPGGNCHWPSSILTLLGATADDGNSDFAWIPHTDEPKENSF